MDEGSLIGSLDRIEAALGRIEAAAQAIASGEADVRPDAEDDTASDDLARRHDQLRTRVTAALARLDTLIGDKTS